MDFDVIEFLQQSNYIENVSDSKSLDQAVLAWKYIIKKDRLTIKSILHTHKLLMLYHHIDIAEKGSFRKRPVYIGGREGRPWFYVPDLVSQWILAVNNSLTSKFVETKEQKQGVVVAMHIEFENIHPFIDGNGRMGRILINWQLQKMGLPILVIREEDKQSYYKWFR